MAACSSNGDVVVPEEDGKGAIRLSSEIDLKTEDVTTRATDTDINTFKVVLTDSNNQSTTHDYPANNIIPDIPVGNYTITVTSHPNGIPAPAFDTQVYSASTTVEVTKDATAPVTLVCKQVNAGVFFEYDQSLADAGLTAVVPTMTTATDALVYENSSTAVGYFAPGTVTLTVKNGTTELKFGGQTSKDYTLAAQELWKIKLFIPADAAEGSISISATVETTTIPQEDELGLEIPEPPVTTLTVTVAELLAVTETQLATITDLTVTGASISTTAWNKIKGFTALESLSVPDFTGTIPAFWASNKSTLPATLKTFSAPMSANEVPSNAFRNSKIVTVNIPKATSIGASAFQGCSGIVELDLPSVRSVDNSGFNGCSGLTVVKFGHTGTITLGTMVFMPAIVKNADLYLNSAGTEINNVTGTTWKTIAWKSVTGYQP